MIKQVSIVVFLLSAGLVGCASERSAWPSNYAVRSAPTEERNTSLDAAEAALVDLGYTISRRDSTGAVLITEPIAIERTGERSLRADNPLRKIAEVRLTGTGSALKVNCKVLIQEQSADSYRLMPSERASDDLPGHQTAIDRDAATTPAQNTVWRTIRRDMISEREILDRMAESTKAP